MSRVKINGYTSIYFNLSRVIRQGCPISTLLYVLVAETLVEAVREESEIKGIRLPDGLDILTTVFVFCCCLFWGVVFCFVGGGGGDFCCCFFVVFVY